MTEQNENRLDRIERILEKIAERQERTDQQVAANSEQTDNHLDRAERSIAHLAEITDKLISRNAEQIAALTHEMSFLRAAVQGHISQSTPPAHQD